MLTIRASYIFNFGWIIIMLLLAACIALYTDTAKNSRDDSALIWEDSCQVSEQLHQSGAVEIHCSSKQVTVALAAHDNVFTALIGNTPISQRSKIPAICRNYQSGRWVCQVGEDTEFYQFVKITPQDEG